MSDLFDYETTPLDKNFTLLEASAGTGKTYSIQRIVLRYVMQQDVPLQRILVVTFTRAATAELKTRIRAILMEALNILHRYEKGEKLGSEDARVFSLLGIEDKGLELQKLRLKVSLMDIDQLPVFTIDSFFNKMLKDTAFENGNLFEKELLMDASDLREEVRLDLWRETLLKKLDENGDEESVFIHMLISAVLKKEDKNISNLFAIIDRAGDFEIEGAEFSKEGYQESLLIFDQEFRKFKKDWNEQHRDRLRELIVICKKQKERSFGNSGIFHHQFKLETFCLGLDQFILGDNSKAFKSYLQDGGKILAPNFLKYKSGSNSSELSGPELELKVIIEEITQLIESYKNLARSFYSYSKWFFVDRMSRYKAERGSFYIRDLSFILEDRLVEGSASRQALLDKLRSDYQVAIIDEFQDTSPQQCNIFRSLFQSESDNVGKQPFPHLYVVGDPKQSIYRFRGADIYAYMGVSKDPRVRKRKLATNFRSEPSIVKGINQLFEGTAKYLLLEDQSMDVSYNNDYFEQGNETLDLPKPIRLVLGNPGKKIGDHEIVKSVGSEVVTLLTNEEHYQFSQWQGNSVSKRPVAPGDIAILVRKKSEGYKILKELSSRGVPSVFQGSIPVFESEEATSVYHMMHCLLNPRNLRLIRAFLASSLYGGNRCGWDDDHLEEIANYFVEANDSWLKKGFLSAVKKLQTALSLQERMLEQRMGERKLSNFIHIVELLNQAEWSKKLSPYALLTWFGKELARSELSEDEKSLRMEREGRAVRIITTHQCKGLEYPIVFCPFHGGDIKDKASYKNPPFVWHDEKEDYALKVSMTSDHKPSAVLNEIIDDEFRLLYVAVTRAKNLCYLYVSNLKGSSPLVSLFEAKGCDFSSKDKQAMTAVDSIKSWVNSCPDFGIEAIDMDCNDSRFEAIEEKQKTLVSPPEWRRAFWSITRAKSSFSMISKGMDEGRDADAQEEAISQLSDGRNILVDHQKISGHLLSSFRGGTKTGSILHDTMEEILNLGWSEREAVVSRRFPLKEKWDSSKDGRSILEKNRYDIEEMLDVLYNLDLRAEDDRFISLAKITPENCLPEISFDFKFNGNFKNQDSIADAISTHPRLSSYASELRSLKANPGFMNGIIDLVFEQNGKFYILDWKTNTLPDYHIACLDDAMASSHYYLQYHIYLLALHLYLKSRISEYEYETHFGGVYYLFLRGIQVGESHGVFFDKPPRKTIEAMERLWNVAE